MFIILIQLTFILKVLIQLTKEKPDMYLDEMVNEMMLRTGKTVSTATISRSLKYCGITRKKVILLAV